MAELIKTTDSLNDGRKKLNDAITDSNAALSTANTAKQTANLAKAESESTQTQLDTIVIEGDSSVEAAQARVNNSGTAFPTLKQRLDAEHQEVTAQLAQNMQYERNADRPLVIPTYDGSGQTTHPSVVYLDTNWNGYRYWMAHTPYANSFDDLENPSIVASNDGITWETPVGLINPIDQPTPEEHAENMHMSDTHLMFINNRLECWYRFTDKKIARDWFFRKTSTDGVNWSERETMFDSADFGNWYLSPSLIYEDSKYRMWTVGRNDDVYYCESTTGKDWSTPVVVSLSYRSSQFTPWHSEVFKENNKYYILLNAFIGANTTSSKRVICLGESSDGLSFTDIHQIIDAPPRYSNRWDDEIIYRASIINTGNHYKLYYSAMNVNAIWGIGMIEGDTLDNLKTSKYRGFDGYTGIDKINTHDLKVTNEVYFRDEDLNSAKLKVMNKNGRIGIHVLTGSENPGNFNAGSLTAEYDTYTKNLYASRILKQVGAANFQLPDEVLMISTGKSPYYKFLNSGVGGAGLKVEKPHILRVVNDSGDKNGAIEVNGVVFNSEGLEAGNIEGAIRYNKTTKKHQGYDGSTWHDLY